MTTTTGQRSLSNFYESVKFMSPTLAADIHDDVMLVAMYGIAADNSPAKEAAERLRRVAWDMPVIHARVLDSALEELGF